MYDEEEREKQKENSCIYRSHRVIYHFSTQVVVIAETVGVRQKSIDGGEMQGADEHQAERRM